MILGVKNKKVAVTYNNIGGVYEEQSNYELALEYYQKSLRIKEELLGGNHEELALSYNNIGSVYQARGEDEESMDYFN